jgi:hypothetical protein
MSSVAGHSDEGVPVGGVDGTVASNRGRGGSKQTATTRWRAFFLLKSGGSHSPGGVPMANGEGLVDAAGTAKEQKEGRARLGRRGRGAEREVGLGEGKRAGGGRGGGRGRQAATLLGGRVQYGAEGAGSEACSVEWTVDREPGPWTCTVLLSGRRRGLAISLSLSISQLRVRRVSRWCRLRVR